MNKKIIILYVIFILLAILLGFLILSNNIIFKQFTYGLIGILFIVAGYFGLITKSFFLGRAVIIPYKSEFALTKVSNIVVVILGFSLILLNLYRILIQ